MSCRYTTRHRIKSTAKPAPAAKKAKTRHVSFAHLLGSQPAPEPEKSADELACEMVAAYRKAQGKGPAKPPARTKAEGLAELLIATGRRVGIAEWAIGPGSGRGRQPKER